ncbi:MAG: carbohydrate binding domain-containing protein, partial [Bacteroidaceae bacterium]|nr:carbohydrate binding domain-containing protein [Bacteroidaceae bacterium]
MKKTLLSLFAILMATVTYAGDGTKENPFTIAEVKTNCPTDGSAINDVYVKGYIVGTAKSGSAFAEEPVNSNLFIAESQTETDANNCVPVELKKGSNARTELNLVDHPDNIGKLIVLCGSITKYFSVPGVKSVTEFTLSGESTNPGDSGSGDEGGNEGGDVDLPTTLSNGSFETWADGVADGWKSASTANNGTVTQSAEAHSGTYAAMLANAKTNKRLASSEIALEAGTYTFSFYVKSASSDTKGSLKPGYVPVTKEGESYSVGTYVYGSQVNSITTDWTQISYEFTLEEKAIVCLVVMNTKSTDSTPYADLIIDDASLTKKVDSGNDDPGTTTQTNYIFTKATSLTNGGKYLIGAMVDGVVKVAQNLP